MLDEQPIRDPAAVRAAFREFLARLARAVVSELGMIAPCSLPVHPIQSEGTQK